MKKCPILYSFRRCPYAIRARMALGYAGVEVELREVKLSNLPDEMLEISPKGTVPVLQLGDGAVLEESLDIIDWALNLHDPDNWVDNCDEGLINENDRSFKPLLDRYKYADRNPEKTQPEHRAHCLDFLSSLEERLQDQNYLSANQAGKTDIAIMPFIRQFAGVEPAWFKQCPYAATRNWLNRMLLTPLFQTVMVKRPVWKAGDGVVYFP